RVARGGVFLLRRSGVARRLAAVDDVGAGVVGGRPDLLRLPARLDDEGRADERKAASHDHEPSSHLSSSSSRHRPGSRHAPEPGPGVYTLAPRRAIRGAMLRRRRQLWSAAAPLLLLIAPAVGTACDDFYTPPVLAV